VRYIFSNAAVIDERLPHPLRILEGAHHAIPSRSGFEDCDTPRLGVDLGSIKQRSLVGFLMLSKSKEGKPGLAVSPQTWKPSGSAGSTGVPGGP